MIVAFTGKRGSGKNTAAQALIDLGFADLSFAAPLRAIAQMAYGVTYEEMGDTVLKEKVLDRYPFKSPRELLTYIGTEMFRVYIDDTWVRALEREAAKHANCVITDLRFLNEEKMLNGIGGTIIRIVNPRRVDADVVSQHRSETEMDQIVPTFTIINDGTVEFLHSQVRTLIEETDGK